MADSSLAPAGAPAHESRDAAHAPESRPSGPRPRVRERDPPARDRTADGDATSDVRARAAPAVRAGAEGTRYTYSTPPYLVACAARGAQGWCVSAQKNQTKYPARGPLPAVQGWQVAASAHAILSNIPRTVKPRAVRARAATAAHRPVGTAPRYAPPQQFDAA